MKAVLSFALFLSFSVKAAEIDLKDYDYLVRDIKSLKVSKENIFEKMDRSIMKIDDSICSNRAQMWAWDFHLDDVPSAKIFLFFTPKNSRFAGNSWWYHVSPIVNENGEWFALDAGNPDIVKSVLSVSDWLKVFTGKNSVCKEITHNDTELLKLINKGRIFPETTSVGKFDCYYKITPPGYWIPGQVAKNALGENDLGEPVRFERTEPVKGDVFNACLEATTSMWGYATRQGRGICSEFLVNGSKFNL